MTEPLCDRGLLVAGLYFGTTSRFPGKGFVSGPKWFRKWFRSAARRGVRLAVKMKSEGPALKRKPRLGGRRGLLNEAGIGGIIGFGNQTHEAGKGSNNNAAQAEYDRLGGAELIAEVPQILQPLIGLAGLKSGSTWNPGSRIAERQFS